MMIIGAAVLIDFLTHKEDSDVASAFNPEVYNDQANIRLGNKNSRLLLAACAASTFSLHSATFLETEASSNVPFQCSDLEYNHRICTKCS